MALNDTLRKLEADGWKTTLSFSNDELEPGGVYVAMFGCPKVGIEPLTAQRLGEAVGVYVIWQGADPATPNIYETVVIPKALVTIGAIAKALNAVFAVVYPSAVASIPLVGLSSWDAVKATIDTTTEIADTVTNVMKTLDGIAGEASRATSWLPGIAKGIFWVALAGGAAYLGYRFYWKKRRK